MTTTTDIRDQIAALDINGSFSDMLKAVKILRKATGADITQAYPVQDGKVFCKLATSKPQDKPIAIAIA